MMIPLSATEVRERFLRFYEARGHVRMPSDSLVPANDPTLLFTGAGMNQFKDMFLGRGTLPHRRVTTAQKCLRVPDLDNVGATPRHHTFFEMLGHFSFGDYFKKECIQWEWEFFTQELGIPSEQLVVTVYDEDHEAHRIWRDLVGLPESRIYRFGEKENFWPAEAPSKGPNGPCGPCSEVYFDRTPEVALPAQENLRALPDARFTEIGNCVFTQFDRLTSGELAPLPQKNIDVGLGLERIVAVLAGAGSNFETDLFQPYLREIAARARSPYGADVANDIRIRRIADHVRAVTFCISDGALPSNEGRGYVVRKILRRAARDGFELGIQGPFLHELVPLVSAIMGQAYPEVREHAEQCRVVIRAEEDSFAMVYRHGSRKLREYLDGIGKQGEGSVASPGEFAFLLHDTYGFPVDITRQAMLEAGVDFDERTYETAMEAQRVRARTASATTGEVFAESVAARLRDSGVRTTEFIGYDTLSSASLCCAVLDADRRPVTAASAGAEVLLIVDKTPFYAMGGGQVGDRGSVAWTGGHAEVETTSAMEGFHLHHARIVEGTLSIGAELILQVDSMAREATARNHTATHLLHAALKRQIGPHVSQAGSEVSPDRLRFDYTHGERLDDLSLRAVEDDVNRAILSATPVVPAVRPLAEARQSGFVAMFGEKYGTTVRTLSIGEFSKELCGGTHVANTGNIGLFLIQSDVAISAGTRRMECVTGVRALESVRRDRASLAALGRTLKVPLDDVEERVGRLLEEIRTLRRDLEKATAADVGEVLRELEAATQRRAGANTVVFEARGLRQKEIQELLTRARVTLDPFAGIVVARSEDGVLVAATVSASLIPRVRANDLVKRLSSVLGGGGGGRPELAQGRGKDAERVPEAIDLGRRLLADAL